MSAATNNLALNFLEEVGENLSRYDGWCMRLVERVIEYFQSKGREDLTEVHIVHAGKSENNTRYIKPSKIKRTWVFHAVIAVGGLIHDPWFGEPICVDKYLEEMFPGQDVKTTPPIDELRAECK